MSGGPREDEVAAALQHLLTWPDIARSGQLAKFLRYIVERTLAGEGGAIKAYAIAVDVFGRPGDFDPQSDPIVRVQARRLRTLLDVYYQGEGRFEPVRITLPTGRYVPEFVRQNVEVVSGETLAPAAVPPLPALPRRLAGWRSWVPLAVVGIGIVALAFILSTWGPRPLRQTQEASVIEPPSVTVTEFQSLTGNPADLGLVAGLAIEIVTDLEPFEMVNAHYGGGAAAAGTAMPTDYVLSGIMRRESGGLQYSAILTDTASGAVVWNTALTLDETDTRRPDLLDHVSVALNRVLGSPRGPLHRKARVFLAANASLDGRETLYVCRVLFDLYRERGTLTSGERARRCFAALGEPSRNSGPALAAVASLDAEGVPSATTLDMSPGERLDRAGQMLAEAVDAAPFSAFVWEQRARFYELVGENDLSEAAYSSSLQLNPASTDAMAARARHMALMGFPNAASLLAQDAIAEAPNPPAWYFAVPTLDALRDRDFADAARFARTYAEADRELGPVLAVMAGQGLRDSAFVDRYLPRVLDYAGFRERGVLPELQRRISDRKVLDDIRVSLLAAGVPETSLNAAF